MITFTALRKINAYQRSYRERHGCPSCRAKIETRHRQITDEEGKSKYGGSYIACVNYKAGGADDCSYYINNIDKPDMREVIVGDAAPDAPNAAYRDPASRIIRRMKPESRKMDLTQVHTKQLLNGLRSFRAAESRAQEMGWYDEVRTGPSHVSKEFLGFKSTDKVIEPTLAEVKAELATREHVPNKQEAKKIRQERAQNKR